METLTIYWDIAWTFILANGEIILNILFLILFTCIMIWDYKLFMKVLKEKTKLSIENFSLKLISRVLFDILWDKNKQIKELEARVYQLENQKKSEKYRLEKKYLALKIATQFFLSKWAFKTIRSRYFIYNKKTLSFLEKINEDEKNKEKDLKKTKKNI